MGDEEVLIKVCKVGICGSDLFALETVDKSVELRLGHEWVGVVEKSLSDRFKVGDLVSSTAFIGCGECHLCLDEKSNFCENGLSLGGLDLGMLRSKIILPAAHLLKIEKFSLNESVLLEVAAVAEEAISQVLKLGLKKDHKILVFGGGPVGLFTSLKLKNEGYNYTLVEKDSFRIKMAKDLGVNILPLGLSLLGESSQFSYVIDASGNGNNETGFWKYANFFVALDSICLVVGKYKGKVELDSNLFAMKNLTVKWMRGMPKETLNRTRDYWSKDLAYYSKLTSQIISHEYDFQHVQDAFDKALVRDNCMKVVINVENN